MTGRRGLRLLDAALRSMRNSPASRAGERSPVMPDRIEALAFNELSDALKDVDWWVTLTERLEIARRVVAVVGEEIRREMAKRVLFVSEAARGLRCPVCHGKPAVQPHILEKDPQYRCGGGHAWRRPLVIDDLSARPEALLRRVAERGVLPPLPARIEQEAADG
jgi:hypothetical protein